jgi:hypothetical protein
MFYVILSQYCRYITFVLEDYDLIHWQNNDGEVLQINADRDCSRVYRLDTVEEDELIWEQVHDVSYITVNKDLEVKHNRTLTLTDDNVVIRKSNDLHVLEKNEWRRL